MNSNSILVPDVGSDAEVEVIEILVASGDEIAIDDPVVVLESDKASIEVPASQAGKVESLSVKVGDRVKQGDPLLEVSAEGSSSEELSEQGAAVASDEASNSESDHPSTKLSKKTEQDSVNELRVPDLGGAKGVEVIEISVVAGDVVAQDDTVLVLESDKASMDIPSPYAGVIKELKVKVGDKLEENDLIALIQGDGVEVEVSQAPGSADSQGEEVTPPQAAQPTTKSNSVKPGSADIPKSSLGGDVHAGPAVRKLARELGVELERVHATGPKGRIQKEDLNSYIKTQVQAAQSGQVGTLAGAPELPDFSQFGEIETRKLDKLHLLTARNMQSSWTHVPHVTQFDEADISELEHFRKSKKLDAESKGVKLTPLPFLIKACAQALRELPQFNVSLDLANQQLIQKHYFNIGVAVDTNYGLVVPVIKDVLNKDLWQISADLGEMADKAKARKLAPSDMQGACFTISSLGSIGGTAFTPIVNQPEVAILGVSKAQIKPVFNGTEFEPRLMMPLSLSYDHRAVNGADAARFTTLIAKYLSDIRELLF